MTNKFTLGPWKILEDKTLNDSIWIGPKQFFSVAEVRNGANDLEYGGAETEKANAHLIAAAPELYEALESIIAMNVQYCVDRYGYADKAEEMSCVVVARKALAKARGES